MKMLFFLGNKFRRLMTNIDFSSNVWDYNVVTTYYLIHIGHSECMNDIGRYRFINYIYIFLYRKVLCVETAEIELLSS